MHRLTMRYALMTLSVLSIPVTAEAYAPSCYSQTIEWCSSNARFSTLVNPADSGTVSQFNAKTTIQTAQGPTVIDGRLTLACQNGQWVKLSESCKVFGSSAEFTQGASITSGAGSASSSVAIESSDPCATDTAGSIFAARAESAKKQSEIMDVELGKTVADPTIAEEAIKNARTCNDMVLDSLLAIFDGTPVGGVISFLGLDSSDCDSLYSLYDRP